MSIMIDGPTKIYSGLKKVAYWTKVHCDSTFKLDKGRAIENYQRILKYRVKNSTVADIAFQDVVGKKGLFYPEHFNKNMKELRKDPVIAGLYQMAQNNVEKLYPKTKSLRKKLIENNRFNLESVTPKMSKIQKFLFKL